MADDRRVYSDEEFALILRKAAELASRAESPGASSTGLTMTEMKSAATQAGLDPALVERAARLVAAEVNESSIERLIGGPVRHHNEARFPIELDENGATRLLSAVRIAASLAGRRDVGHASSMGMTWHDGGEAESLGITARPEGEGTTVTVAVDRRGTLGVVGMVSGITMFFVVLFSVFALYPESPALGIGGFIAGGGGIFAAARGYWASSTRKVRERINVIIDVIAQTMDRSGETCAGVPTIVEGAVARELDADTVITRSLQDF